MVNHRVHTKNIHGTSNTHKKQLRSSVDVRDQVAHLNSKNRRSAGSHPPEHKAIAQDSDVKTRNC